MPLHLASFIGNFKILGSDTNDFVLTVSDLAQVHILDGMVGVREAQWPAWTRQLDVGQDINQTLLI